MSTQNINGKKKRVTLNYRLVSALGACLLWGAWAYYVNSATGGYTALFAAISQGFCSLVFTLLIIRAVTVLYGYFSPSALRLIIPAMTVVGGLGIILLAVHNLTGTPNIFYTIMPPLALAFIFCVYTSFRLDNA